MSDIPFVHTSVLLKESVDGLNVRDSYTYVDCTTGGGGHSLEIARRMGKNGRLICFDRDECALKAAGERLAAYRYKITFIHDNFENIGTHLTALGIKNLGGVLADLGCSSPQFDNPERGFSYMHNARLDMRMDTTAPLDAYTVVNTYGEDELRRIISEYGEERFAGRIAAAIVRARENAPVEMTAELSDIIKSAIPAAARTDGPHPAKRTFQAIRIEVNKELDAIAPTIRRATDFLVSGGRIAMISFHSLEDRIIKDTYRELSSGCICPRDFPVCVCGRKPVIRIVNKKPILPTDTAENPRARSAKLRIAEKI